ncbi:MAG: hypothetical protein KAT58_10705 [candidate division Zixibacteria bacterium]|nr:hypothetical protein [candidate division Zixibacteria bacterium]
MPKKPERPYIGVIFKCCHIYSRVYLNKQGTAYVGRCPKCARQFRIKVSPHGSHDRFFELT